MSMPGNKTGRGCFALTDKRWLAYSVAAGATGVAAPHAAGSIEHYEVNIDVQQGFEQTLYINNDTYIDIRLQNYIFLSGNYQGAYVEFFPGRVVGFRAGPSNRQYATALYGGEVIDETTTVAGIFDVSLAYGATNPNAQFNNATDAMIGFSFPAGSKLLYAWVRVDIDNAAGTFLIKDFAFENQSGVGILAGQTTGGAPVPGDADGDGDVDLDDFDILADNMYTSNDAGPAGGDFNNDGQTNFDDYVIQALNFGTGAQDPEDMVSPLPEPGTLGFLAAGSAGLTFFRRRRKQG